MLSKINQSDKSTYDSTPSSTHETSKINELKKKENDLWITVLDLEGNFDTSVQEP